tara:strand:+ start:11132 stop:11638 length:507 start_codon:yes stop_codon:yes gene_type:complete
MAVVVSYTTVSLMNMTLAEIGSMATMTNSVLLLHAYGAENIINAKISKRYSLPITDSVPILETLATDMAIYRVITGRIVLTKEHPWFARFKDMNKTLDQIANGDLQLVASDGTVLAGKNTGAMEVWSNTKDYAPTHWEGDWTLHIQDEDKIQNEADERDLGDVSDRLL